MDLSRRSNNSHEPEQAEEGLRHQMAAIDPIKDFHEHDVAALAELTTEQRIEQLAARQLLYNYVGAIWDRAKARGLSPADLPEYNAVAAMRDLMNDLVDDTVQAKLDAGEELAR